jgi:hypothetical protein
LDNRILEEFEKPGFFKDMDINEKKVLAIFISSTYKSSFKLKDLQKYLERYPAIKHTSSANLRKKIIEKLMEEKILVRFGEGRGTYYQMTESFIAKVFAVDADIFSLPRLKIVGESRVEEMDELSKMLESTDRIYIQAPEGHGKSAFIVKFCHDNKDHQNFYYAELGEAGLNKFFKGIFTLLDDHEIDSATEDPIKQAVDTIHPHLSKLFIQKNGRKPVLVLDDVHLIADPADKEAYMDMAKTWKEVILILLGDKMDNAFFDDFTPFPLKKWDKK